MPADLTLDNDALRWVSNMVGDKHYDQIAFLVRKDELELGPADNSAGVFNYYKTVYTEDEAEVYYPLGKANKKWPTTKAAREVLCQRMANLADVGPLAAVRRVKNRLHRQVFETHSRGRAARQSADAGRNGRLIGGARVGKNSMGQLGCQETNRDLVPGIFTAPTDRGSEYGNTSTYIPTARVCGGVVLVVGRDHHHVCGADVRKSLDATNTTGSMSCGGDLFRWGPRRCEFVIRRLNSAGSFLGCWL